MAFAQQKTSNLITPLLSHLFNELSDSPKTGSSALQVFLSNNVNSLLDHGISYPNSELPPTTAANQHRQQSNGGNLIRTMKKAAARTRVTCYDETELAEPFLKATLMEVIENRKSRSLLLSGEFLSAPKPTEILTRLFPKLQNKFHITVIAFVRDPHDHLLSGWKQRIGTGFHFNPLGEWLERYFSQRYTPYDSLLTYAKLADSMQLVSYDHNKSDLFGAFLKVLGLAEDNPTFQRPREMINPSITTNQARLICEAAKHVETAPLRAQLISRFHSQHYDSGLNEKEDPILEIENAIATNLLPKLNAINAYLPEGEKLRTLQRTGVSISKIHYAPSDVVDLLQSMDQLLDTIGVDQKTVPNKIEKVAGLPEDFNSICYLMLNPDVRDANVDPIDHYLNHGRYEGRNYK